MTPSPPTTPRWRDAHLHLLEHGESLSAVQLGDCTTIDDVLQRLARAARNQPQGWIIARRLHVHRLREGRLPIAAEIDAAVGQRACCIWTFDLHAMTVSSAALHAAQLMGHQPPPVTAHALGGAAGVIERDARGMPTGVLLESAVGAVTSVMPTPDELTRLRFLRAAIADLRAHNIVEAHEMFARADVMASLIALEKAGELDGLRIRAYATRDHLDAVRHAIGPDHANRHVRFGGLKLFLDGTLNSRTAFMLSPGADPLPDHPRGIANYSLATLVDQLRWAEERRLDVAAHAIGDAAVRLALDAHDALARHLARAPHFQFRIEHAQFIDEADVPRFTHRTLARPIIASLQPCHLLADIEAIQRLTPARAHRAFPIRDLIDAALVAGRDLADVLWLGSDAPVVPARPLDNRQACLERRRPGMPPDQAVGPGQAIDEAMWRRLQAAP